MTGIKCQGGCGEPGAVLIGDYWYCMRCAYPPVTKEPEMVTIPAALLDEVRGMLSAFCKGHDACDGCPALSEDGTCQQCALLAEVEKVIPRSIMPTLQEVKP